jgi:acyl-CoA reductase-like NAD-dependent aldehyde dehydrogenase
MIEQVVTRNGTAGAPASVEEVVLQNIIGGTPRDPTERKIVGRFSFPVTTTQEVASALRSAKFQEPASIEKVIAALSKIGRDAKWINDEDLAIQAELSGSPIKHMRSSIEAINSWLANIEAYVKLHGTLETIVAGDDQKLVLIDQNGRLCQGGVTTTFVLAGDEIAIAPWNMAQALLAGTRAIIKPSRIEPLSAFLFTKALIEEKVTPPALLYISRETETEQGLLATLIKQTRQSVMYGEDNTVDTICSPFGFRADHKYFTYLTGRSGAIVYPDANVDLAAEMIIRGATDDRGNRCNSTKKVFASKQLKEQMEAALIEQAERLVRGEPTDPATDIGRNDPRARAIAEQWTGSARVFYDRDMFLMAVEQSAQILKEELPYPTIAICYYEEGQDPVDLINKSVAHSYLDAAVAISIFTENREQYNIASSRIQACKTILNLPTTSFDFWTSHQRWHLFIELMRKVELVAS